MPTYSRYTDHKARSLAEFANVTFRIRTSWEQRGNIPDPWFRGLSSVAHTLTPGWYRLGKKSNGVDEDDLIDEFQRRAIPLLEGHRPETLWEWYFIMQHYGLPTRLLDWSESSLVGLFFAVGDWKGTGQDVSSDAVVWMMDPWHLNKASTRKDAVFRYDDPEPSRFLPRKLYDSDRSPRKPIALTPPLNSRRITAQRGVFTIHGKSKKPIDQLLPAKPKPHLAKIVIPMRSVEKVRDQVRLAGMTDATLFPELPYLCQDILKNWHLIGS